MLPTRSDGTHAIVFEPLSFISRLVAMIPPPRFHMLRFAGVLAAHSSLRAEIVPAGAPNPAAAGAEQLPLFIDSAVLLPITHPTQEPSPSRPSRHAWGFLMQHVFAKDVWACPRCQGRLRIVEVAQTAEAIARVLVRAGLGPRPPPRHRAVSANQLAVPLG
jgi:hypothetical protein